MRHSTILKFLLGLTALAAVAGEAPACDFWRRLPAAHLGLELAGRREQIRLTMPQLFGEGLRG